MSNGKSRLALHVQRWNYEAEVAVSNLRNSRHIKIMDIGQESYRSGSVARILSEYKANNPSATVGYRYYNEDTDQSNGERNLDKHEKYTLDAIAQVRKHGMKDIVDIIYTPYNEVFPYDGPKFSEYLDALESMCKIIVAYGFDAAAGNWSVTAPHPLELWDRISDKLFPPGYIPLAKYIVLHGYSQPDLLAHQNELYPHERVNQYLRSKGKNLPTFILGEFGVDHALYTSPPDYRGWRASMGEMEMARQLDGANDRLAGTPNLYAANLFGAGAKGEWITYDYTDCPLILKSISRIPEGTLGIDEGTQLGIPRGEIGNLTIKVDSLPGGELSARPWLVTGVYGLFSEWRNTDR